MQHRRLTRRRFVVPALLALGIVAAPPPSVRAAAPTRGLVIRPLQTSGGVPAGADALRVAVYGDASGATLQLRLLALGANGPAVAASANYYESPPLAVDFKGWKTVSVPLADMVFRAEQAPGAGPAGAFALASADTVGVALTGTAARVFLDDLAWANGDTAVQPIDAFDGSSLGARAVGGYDQVAATSVSLNRVAAFAKSGGSLQLTVIGRATRERRLYGPALLARLKRAPAATTYPYALYSRPPFEPIVPESTPAPAEVSTTLGAAPQIRVFACPDEIEPATFSVFAGRTLKNATVTLATDFAREGSSAKFSRAAANVHVVKVWEQAGLGPFAGPGAKPVTVGECLVKDDRVPLTGPDPAIRLTGDPVTDIAEGTSKQFWVTIRVPRGQAPGLYRGRLLFSAVGVKPAAVPIVVEVLPLRLRSAFLQYGVDLRSRVGGPNEAQTAALPGDSVRVSSEEYARELANIRDHGFRWVSLYDRPGDLESTLRLYKDSGLNAGGPVVLMSGVENENDAQRVEQARAGAGLPGLQVYFGTPAASPDAAAQTLQTIHGAGARGLLVAPITGPSLEGALGSLVDVPVFSVGADYAQALLATGKRTQTKRDWWSWNLAQENAPLNRLYAGFLLYRTGIASAPLYGAFAGPYRYAPPGVDPFNETAATAGGDAAAPALRPQMVTYPVQNGMLDTVQWEAAREGVDDIRYITTLKDFSRQLKDLQSAKGVATGKADLVEAEQFLVKTMGTARPLGQMTPGEMQLLRRGIADRTIRLLGLVRQLSGDRTIN